jgi:hypothetical protein
MRTYPLESSRVAAASGSADPEEFEHTWHKYIAYGLGIHSEVPLPELMAATTAKRDVVIRLGRVAHRLGGADQTYTYFQPAADEAFLRWGSVGTFLARSGREIILEPAAGAAQQDVRRVLESHVLGVIAHQRGMLALYATTVAIRGEAVAFLAAKREGRFAMAATLHARGHALLALDLLVLAGSTTGPVAVLPGFPQLRLRPPALVSGARNRGSQNHSRVSLPLRCVYVVKKGTSLALGMLNPREALVAILRDSYAARMFPQSLWGMKAAAHFVRCAALVDRVPMYRLEQPEPLAVQGSSAQMVEAHFSEGSYGTSSPVVGRVIS